jgi:DNA-binding NarL/FixJ family response regulator
MVQRRDWRPTPLLAATARTHVSRLLMKLGALDRAQLVMIAYETGMVTPG